MTKISVLSDYENITFSVFFFFFEIIALFLLTTKFRLYEFCKNSRVVYDFSVNQSENNDKLMVFVTAQKIS